MVIYNVRNNGTMQGQTNKIEKSYNVKSLKSGEKILLSFVQRLDSPVTCEYSVFLLILKKAGPLICMAWDNFLFSVC